MERTGAPLRLLLEACSFTFETALTITGGPGALVSAPPALTGLLDEEDEEEEEADEEMSALGKAVAGARVVGRTAGVEGTEGGTGTAGAGLGASQGASGLGRDQDESEAASGSDQTTAGGREVAATEAAEAAAAAAAANAAAIAAAAAAEEVTTGGGAGSARDRELPPSMLEVLKVSLSVMRRLSNRNLAVAGPFASMMQVWPPGHPQVRFCYGGGWSENFGGGGYGSGK